MAAVCRTLLVQMLHRLGKPITTQFFLLRVFVFTLFMYFLFLSFLIITIYFIWFYFYFFFRLDFYSAFLFPSRSLDEISRVSDTRSVPPSFQTAIGESIVTGYRLIATLCHCPVGPPRILREPQMDSWRSSSLPIDWEAIENFKYR